MSGWVEPGESTAPLSSSPSPPSLPPSSSSSSRASTLLGHYTTRCHPRGLWAVWGERGRGGRRQLLADRRRSAGLLLLRISTSSAHDHIFHQSASMLPRITNLSAEPTRRQQRGISHARHVRRGFASTASYGYYGWILKVRSPQLVSCALRPRRSAGLHVVER